MKAIKCTSCGSTDLIKKDGFWICQHCGTKNYFTEEELPAKESDITLDSDVEVLLRKWDKDPAGANRYAKLILQIDPNNKKAKEQLYGKPKSGCYVATAVYGSYDCPEVWVLRRYRDQVLAKSVPGRMFIRTYYATSPTLVKMFGEKGYFKKGLKPILDYFVERLKKKGFKDSSYVDRKWE